MGRQLFRRLFVFMPLLNLGFTFNAMAAVAASDSRTIPSFHVRFQKHLVSIEANEATWDRVLGDLSRKTGVIFHVRPAMEDTVTVSFRDLPLDRALQHLFGPEANFMFVYRNPPSQIGAAALPAEVWISREGQSRTVHTVVSDDAEPASDEAGQAIDKTINEFERNPQAAKDAARRHSDPAVRETAIRYLGEQRTEDGITVLLDVLRESDPHMRQTALDALGAAVENDPRVREFMTQVIQTTKDPEVKQFVADALGVTADKAGF